jgi:hypothetical protein
MGLEVGGQLPCPNPHAPGVRVCVWLHHNWQAPIPAGMSRILDMMEKATKRRAATPAEVVADSDPIEATV